MIAFTIPLSIDSFAFRSWGKAKDKIDSRISFLSRD
jgi:hypothetical protein